MVFATTRVFHTSRHAILAAREPLPVEILQSLFSWQDEELRDFTRPLGSLFPVTTEGGHEVIKPYHKSLAEWLADETKAGPYFVSMLVGHRLLAGIEWSSGYATRHLPCHLHEAGNCLRLYELLHNPEFLELCQRENAVISWPIDLRSWAYDGSHLGYYPNSLPPIPPMEAYNEPGAWFRITDCFFGSAIDWTCNRCGLLGGTTPGRKYGSPGDRCPSCAWEGIKSEREAWLRAKAEFEKKRQAGGATS